MPATEIGPVGMYQNVKYSLKKDRNSSTNSVVAVDVFDGIRWRSNFVVYLSGTYKYSDYLDPRCCQSINDFNLRNKRTRMLEYAIRRQLQQMGVVRVDRFVQAITAQ